MKLDNNYTANRITPFGALTKQRMKLWRSANSIPSYTNAAYKGYTGAKLYRFPTYYKEVNGFPADLPDVTKNLKLLEEDILQELKDTREKPFGYFRVLWKMAQNFGTGERWDTKFLPEFPGRNMRGERQYAMYKDEAVSGNDVSNILFGHVCKYLGFPEKVTLLLARLDAAGILEPFSKGKLPDGELLRFRDTQSDQKAILRGMREFDIKDYRLRDSR